MRIGKRGIGKEYCSLVLYRFKWLSNIVGKGIRKGDICAALPYDEGDAALFLTQMLMDPGQQSTTLLIVPAESVADDVIPSSLFFEQPIIAVRS